MSAVPVYKQTVQLFFTTYKHPVYHKWTVITTRGGGHKTDAGFNFYFNIHITALHNERYYIWENMHQYIQKCCTDWGGGGWGVQVGRQVAQLMTNNKQGKNDGWCVQQLHWLRGTVSGWFTWHVMGGSCVGKIKITCLTSYQFYHRIQHARWQEEDKCICNSHNTNMQGLV